MNYALERPYNQGSLYFNSLDARFVEPLQVWFGSFFRSTEVGPSDVDIVIQISMPSIGRYKVCYIDQIVETDSFLRTLSDLLFFNARLQTGIFGIHAGAVEVEGKAYLFTAPTTVGKTTLIAYLCHLGMRYMSDDCVYLDMCADFVYPHQKPIHLRQGGYDVLESHQAAPLGGSWLEERYTFMPALLSAEKVPLGRIFFIERGGQNLLEPVSSTVSIETLMKSASVPFQMDMAHVRFFHSLSRRCLRMEYSRLDYVEQTIRTFASESKKQSG